MKNTKWLLIPVLAIGLTAALAFSQEEEQPEGGLQPKAEGLKPLGEGLAGEMKEMQRRFTDLLKRLEELGLLGEGDMEELLRSVPRVTAKDGSSSSTVIKGILDDGEERIEYERRADGSIKVTLTRDGKSEVYEAKSLDELKEKAPEVHAKVAPHLGRVRIHLDPRPDPFKDWPGIDDWLEPFRRGPRLLHPRGGLELGEVPGGFRLGVWVGEICEALRYHLKLGPKEGVLIEQVVPGSLADKAGVKRLDIVLRVNGIPTGSAADIRKSVSGIAKGAEVKLDVIRRGAAMGLKGSR